MDTQNEPLARVSNEFLDYQYQVLGIGEHMHSSEVTEICINRPGELYLETAREGWLKADVPSLTFERARQFCTSVVNESNTGQRITDIDPMRAYCIAMAATLTVIVASQLGMPVSTTHISIGAVFGVGFLRELLKVNYAKMEAAVRAGHQGTDREDVEAYMQRFEAAEVQEKKRMLAEMKQRAKVRGLEGAVFAKGERKAFKKAYKKEIVKRSVVMRIIAAWIVTVPATAVLAAILFHLVSAVLA